MKWSSCEAAFPARADDLGNRAHILVTLTEKRQARRARKVKARRKITLVVSKPRELLRIRAGNLSWLGSLNLLRTQITKRSKVRSRR